MAERGSVKAPSWITSLVFRQLQVLKSTPTPLKVGKSADIHVLLTFNLANYIRRTWLILIMAIDREDLLSPKNRPRGLSENKAMYFRFQILHTIKIFDKVETIETCKLHSHFARVLYGRQRCR